MPVEQTKGVSHIVKGKRPYPDWLRNHTVFKEMDKIDKVFPRIGLPNFKQEVDILNSTEAATAAITLGNAISRHLSAVKNKLYEQLDAALKSADKDRNEICFKLQNVINLIASVMHSLGFGDYHKLVDKKIVMRLRADIFGIDKNPIFRKDEAIFRVFNKLRDINIEVAPKVEFICIENFAEFKEFSRLNVPSKKFNVVFSSHGDNGAWDISTMSMRGITSCQSWGTPQSRGLIGSISSKFVGVMYIESDQEIPGYGQKMLNRCVVRFCINRSTKKPVIILDNMYPAFNQNILDTFVSIIKEKSGLDIVYARGKDGYGVSTKLADYYIPDEPSRKHLVNGEYSYMDSAIAVESHKSSIAKPAPKNLVVLTNSFRINVIKEITAMIKAKRDLYDSANAKIEAAVNDFHAAKAVWIEANGNKPESEQTPFTIEKPKLPDDLEAFGGGGRINLFKHCDKRYGENSAAAEFAKIVFDVFPMPGVEDCATKEEYHRKYLMSFLRNPAKVKAAAWQGVCKGSWMKSFPRASEKFFEFIFPHIKEHVVNSCKELIKKAN